MQVAVGKSHIPASCENPDLLKEIKVLFIRMPILFTAVLFIASSGMAADYYVHPDGADDGPGTRQSPWKTIDRANRQELKAGDRLFLAGGKTFEGNLLLGVGNAGNPERPVLVGSYGAGRATIRAGIGSAVTVRDCGGVEIENLVCIGDDRTKNHGSGVAFINTLPGNSRLKHVRIRNVEASGFGRDLRQSFNKTVGFQPPFGCGIFVGGVARDKSKSGYDDVEITGCDLHDNAVFGVLITAYWDAKATRYGNHRVTIRDCRMHKNPGHPDFRENHSGSGLLVEDTDEALVDRCIAWDNGSLCNNPSGGPCGIWTAAARRVTIQNCESFRNHTGAGPDGNGFDLDGGCIECTLQYNYSHDNDGAGILVYTYPGAPWADKGNIVRYNVCENDAVKLRDYGSITVNDAGAGMSGVQIYNNTFITNQPVSAVIIVSGKDVGVAFRNNIVLSTGPAPVVKIDQDAEKIIFQGNLYWCRGEIFKVVGGRTVQGLDEWRKTGKEMVDGKPVGLFADPILRIDSTRGERGDLPRLHGLKAFLPQAGSPALGAALDLKARWRLDPGSRDFCGRPVAASDGFAIGACERQEKRDQ